MMDVSEARNAMNVERPTRTMNVGRVKGAKLNSYIHVPINAFLSSPTLFCKITVFKILKKRFTPLPAKLVKFGSEDYFALIPC